MLAFSPGLTAVELVRARLQPAFGEWIAVHANIGKHNVGHRVGQQFESLLGAVALP